MLRRIRLLTVGLLLVCALAFALSNNGWATSYASVETLPPGGSSVCNSRSPALAMEGPRLDITQPVGCAVAKDSGFVITLPWGPGITHQVFSAGGYGQGWHDGLCNADAPGTTEDYYALDFDLGLNESVFPVAGGVVTYAGWTPDPGDWRTFGLIVVVDHENGYQSLYAHLNVVSVTLNQRVSTSTQLGGAGNTRGQQDVHLHFALFKDSQVSRPGAPFGGKSVVPEPFRGVDDYVNILPETNLTSAAAPQGHLQIKAVRYSSTQLKVGNTLQVDVDITNDGNAPLQLQGPDNMLYNEAGSNGKDAKTGKWRVGLDYAARSSALDHPYRFGREQTLSPGHSTTIRARVKLSTARTTDYWVGVVQEGNHWEQDKTSRTTISVTGPQPDDAQLVSHLSYPDGTVVQPGQSMNKGWRYRNSGTSTWNSGYHLCFTSGEQMGAPSCVSLPKPVASGTTVDIYVRMTAPGSLGTYRGDWTMKNSSGKAFGRGASIQIVVQQTNAVIVDDLDAAFKHSDPATDPFFEEDGTRGYKGHMYRVCVNNLEGSWGEWRPTLAASGTYEVYVFVPDDDPAMPSYTNDARYEIHHRGGVTTVARAQQPYSNAWVSLGAFTFDSGASGYVRLTDITNEESWGGFSCIYQVAFDAVKWVPLKVGAPTKPAEPTTPKPPSSGCTSTTQRVTFPSGGTSAVYTIDLPYGCTRSYVLRIIAGQVLQVSVNPWDTVQVTVTGPAKNALTPVDDNMGFTSYNAATSGDYTVTLRGTERVTLKIVVPPKAAPAPTPKPPSPGCTSTTQRVTFPPGGTSYKVVANLSAGCTKSYVLRIMAGQTLVLAIGGYDNAGLQSLTVLNPAGKALTADAAAGSRYYACATTGDYTITVRGTGRVEFDITVPPR